MKLSSRDIAQVSFFAALLVIISRLPGIPIMGGTGHIEFTVIFAPVIGIVLGPWLGGLSALIGSFIAWLIPKTTFYGLLNLPLDPLAAIVSGSLTRNGKIANWKLAAVLIAVLNGLWYLTLPGQEVLIYPFMHWGAFILIIIFRSKIAEFVKSANKRKLTVGTSLCCYSGLMANHMAGNLIYIVTVGWFVSLQAIKDAIKSLGLFWGNFLSSVGLIKSPDKWITFGLQLPNVQAITEAIKSLGLYWGNFGLIKPLDKCDPISQVFALILPISVIERLIMTIGAAFLAIGVIFYLRRTGLIKI